MAYFLNVFTPETWSEFVAGGSAISGFSAAMAKRADSVRPGDTLLCYLKRRVAWVGALQAIGPAYSSTEPLWVGREFPVRLPVRPLVSLTTENAMSMAELEGKLSYFKVGMVPSNYSAYLQGSPRRMLDTDGETILRALRIHEDRGRDASVGPGDVSASDDMTDAATSSEPDQSHWEMQLLLAEWGLQSGCSVWVPKNDRLRLHRRRGVTIPFLGQLPSVFGGRAQEIVENIDVLWLDGNSIVAAFEVEHTTSIYSGLLRMSDLVASVPNISIAIYIVAPAARRAQVFRELSRPTFRFRNAPLATKCGFISYERLLEQHSKIGDVLRHVNPNIIRDFAEFADQE